MIKACIIPHLRVLGEDMRAATEGPITNAVDKIACEHIRKQLQVRFFSQTRSQGSMVNKKLVVLSFVLVIFGQI